MIERRAFFAACIAGAVAVLAILFFVVRPSDARDIRARLKNLADDVNAGASDGAGLLARGERIGSYFAEDVVIDLGPGTAPIQGRPTLIGMTERLQPRTAAFALIFKDVRVDLGPRKDVADVTLTAEFVRRSIATGEQSVDAREFSGVMRKSDGEWRIARAAAVELLRAR